MMLSPVVGWSFDVEGEDADLHDCTRIFCDPSKPVIARNAAQSGYVLRASELDAWQSHEDAFQAAEALIARMNGARLLYHDGKPIGLSGSIVSHHENGNRGVIIRVGSVELTLRGGVVQFHGPNGTSVDPSLRTLERAASEDSLDDALVHFGRASNWYELYKAYEATLNAAHTKRLAKSSLVDSASEEDQLKHTFQKRRHHYHKYDGPEMSLTDARRLVREALRRLAERAQ